MEVIINDRKYDLSKVIMVTSVLEGNGFPYFLIRYSDYTDEAFKPEGTIQKYQDKNKGKQFDEDCYAELDVIRDFILMYWNKTFEKPNQIKNEAF